MAADNYTVEQFNELVAWLGSQPGREAEHWAEALRPWAAEYASRAVNETRAYERGFRNGQLHILQTFRNWRQLEEDRVKADAELSAIRVEARDT